LSRGKVKTVRANCSNGLTRTGWSDFSLNDTARALGARLALLSAAEPPNNCSNGVGLAPCVCICVRTYVCVLVCMCIVHVRAVQFWVRSKVWVCELSRILTNP